MHNFFIQHRKYIETTVTENSLYLKNEGYSETGSSKHKSLNQCIVLYHLTHISGPFTEDRTARIYRYILGLGSYNYIKINKHKNQLIVSQSSERTTYLPK